MIQTQLSSSVQRHQRRLSTVHLAGLFILAHAQSAVRRSLRPRRNRNVLKHVSGSLDVLLSIGVIVGDAGDMTHRVAVLIVQPSRSFVSSENVTLHQVRDVNEYFS